MIKKTLATSASCGPCSMLKSKLKALELEVDTKDYSNPEDREFYKKHDIRSVPRLVIENGDNVEIIQGIEEIITAIKNV